MSSRKPLGRDGFTLIELLVSMAIAGILIALVGLAFVGQSKSYNSTQDVMDVQQNIRSSLMFMAQEIRMAGYDPTKLAKATIIMATATQFQFTQDIGGDSDADESDGDTDDSNENIRYALNGDNQLCRETTTVDDSGVETFGGLQPVSDNIMKMEFEYQLEDGRWTQFPEAKDLDAIRAVKVMILGRSPRETSEVAYPGVPESFRPPMESGNPPDWTPADPGHYHWRLMSMVVQCRNMAF